MPMIHPLLIACDKFSEGSGQQLPLKQFGSLRTKVCEWMTNQAVYDVAWSEVRARVTQ